MLANWGDCSSCHCNVFPVELRAFEYRGGIFFRRRLPAMRQTQHPCLRDRDRLTVEFRREVKGTGVIKKSPARFIPLPKQRLGIGDSSPLDFVQLHIKFERFATSERKRAIDAPHPLAAAWQSQVPVRRDGGREWAAGRLLLL